MFRLIGGIALSDPHVASLLRQAQEYAEIYLLAARRQKGCDGMGEKAMIEAEFRDVLDALRKACPAESAFFADDDALDIDAVARGLVPMAAEDSRPP